MEETIKKIFKTRKQGNSVSIGIAKSAQVEAGEHYSFEKDEDGRLIYTPMKVSDNPWHNGAFDHYDFNADVKKIGFNAGYEESVGCEGGQY
ncbi:antitoxin [Lactiplantibacillus plantarum]|uniref:antitoxin n=1 Tax=Lactiplantibacillus plantarum TaxID=1590 RepID=UPI001BAA8FB6|nr:antitoxin [Lactiplantibacillus plantarum]MBS0956708.1 antitoxin [Lactiplantibacillus plantarum]